LANVDHHVIELAFLAGLSALDEGTPAGVSATASGAEVSSCSRLRFWSGAHLFGALLSSGFLAAAPDAWEGR
jgi:hypothetical protein